MKDKVLIYKEFFDRGRVVNLLTGQKAIIKPGTMVEVYASRGEAAKPSFYASTRGFPPCTHRVHETDIPVWCETAAEASKLLDIMGGGGAEPSAIFGLYEVTTRSHYDDFGSDCYETLLATASDPQELKDRWNIKQKEQCLKHGYNHESYFNQIGPPF